MEERNPHNHYQPLKKRRHFAENDLQTQTQAEDSPLDFSLKTTGSSNRRSSEEVLTRDNLYQSPVSHSRNGRVIFSPSEEKILREIHGNMTNKTPPFTSHLHTSKIKSETIGNTEVPVVNNEPSVNNVYQTALTPVMQPVLQMNSTHMNFAQMNGNSNIAGNPIPHHFQNVARFQEAQAISPVQFPFGLQQFPRAYMNGLKERGHDHRSSKNMRPFKQYQQEILNYNSRAYMQALQPMASSLFINATSPVSTIATDSNSPPHHQEPSTSNIKSPQNHQEPSTSNIKSPPNHQEPITSTEFNGYGGDLSSNSSMEETSVSSQQQQAPDSSKTQGGRRKGKKVPEELKDAAYKERRKKNNEAAKRSRENRKHKEDIMAAQAMLLTEENKLLQRELLSTKNLCANLEVELAKLRHEKIRDAVSIEQLKNENERLRSGLSRSCSRNELMNTQQHQENPGL